MGIGRQWSVGDFKKQLGLDEGSYLMIRREMTRKLERWKLLGKPFVRKHTRRILEKKISDSLVEFQSLYPGFGALKLSAEQEIAYLMKLGIFISGAARAKTRNWERDGRSVKGKQRDSPGPEPQQQPQPQPQPQAETRRIPNFDRPITIQVLNQLDPTRHGLVSTRRRGSPWQMTYKEWLDAVAEQTGFKPWRHNLTYTCPGQTTIFIRDEAQWAAALEEFREARSTTTRLEFKMIPKEEKALFVVVPEASDMEQQPENRARRGASRPPVLKGACGSRVR